MFGVYFNGWLKEQPLWVRLLTGCAFAGVCLWLAALNGNWVFLLMALACPLLPLNREDIRRARAWLRR